MAALAIVSQFFDCLLHLDSFFDECVFDLLFAQTLAKKLGNSVKSCKTFWGVNFLVILVVEFFRCGISE